MIKFCCPRCRVISDEVVVLRREDQPKTIPELPTSSGHFTLAVYELDWNRTIVCPECGHNHHYFEEVL